MRRVPRYMVFALALLGIASAPGHSAPPGRRGTEFKVDAKVRAPEIIAVRIHHDMCPHCKRLKPQFEALDALLTDASALLVTLDLSTPATQHQAALLAGALGLESLWTGDLSRIATVTFLDAGSKKTLAEFRADGDQSLEAVARTAISGKHD